MDVTTMQKISSVLKKLENSPPLFAIHFEASDHYAWNKQKNTITYNKGAEGDDAVASLLHEAGHALLEHSDYPDDVSLLAIERAAWDEAKVLAASISITIDDELVESALDTYRDWLHARSTCPNCQATGIQIADRRYQCIACHHEWRVNEARTCALRRYTT